MRSVSCGHGHRLEGQVAEPAMLTSAVGNPGWTRFPEEVISKRYRMVEVTTAFAQVPWR